MEMLDGRNITNFAVAVDIDVLTEKEHELEALVENIEKTYTAGLLFLQRERE